jgi:hypothetical protein
VLEKGVNKPFKHYAREEFESWMVSNGSRKKPTRGEVSQWINMAWDKVTTATIVNTWKSIGHKAGDEEDDKTIIQMINKRKMSRADKRSKTLMGIFLSKRNHFSVGLI